MRTGLPVVIARCAIIVTIGAGMAGCADRTVISPDDPAYNAMGAPGNQAGTDPKAPTPYHPLGNDEEH